jgi:glutathione S-transferase
MVIPKLTLTYFGITARAEPIRLTFVTGGIPFTNKSVEFSEWKDLKPTLPAGKLPLLEIEDANGNKKSVFQSAAILRYAGQLAKMYPEDPLEALAVDMVIDTVEEACLGLSMTVAGAVSCHISDTPWTKEQVLEIRARMLVPGKMNNFPFYLDILEKLLKENGTGWFVGDKPTIADMRALQMENWITAGILDGVPADLLKNYPLLAAHEARVLAIPQVAAWRAKHGTKYTGSFDFVAPEN